MKMLPNNALEGARRAYFAVKPNHNDTHWEVWLNSVILGENGQVQNHRALAKLCDECLEFFADGLEPEVLKYVEKSKEYYQQRAERKGY